MTNQLKYMPVLRTRQQEMAVLQSFDFGQQIYPCIEIIKELDKKPVMVRKGKPVISAKTKTFEEVYLPFIQKIRSPRVFVDIPVHISLTKRIKDETLEFLTRVAGNRIERTNYLLKLKSTAPKMIPVISTYNQRTGEIDSIKTQEHDLRPAFQSIAFRTFPKTFFSDIAQIMAVAQKQDYLILDLGKDLADPDDDDIIDIIDKLKTFSRCHIIILRSAIDDKVTNAGLAHGKKVAGTDNGHTKNFKHLQGHSFGDYVGIKKSAIQDGGTVSPGFIFYDAVENNYYGYKGSPQPTVTQKLDEYAKTIVPAVITSQAALRMKAGGLAYLNHSNEGWKIILQIENNPNLGRNAALFKRISILHYLHCMRSKITIGEFD